MKSLLRIAINDGRASVETVYLIQVTTGILATDLALNSNHQLKG